ncbi:MAG: ATP-binding protein, partial [Actinomycetota bacterium]
MSERVGRVLGSEHTTTSEFRVVLDEDQHLQLDDLVVVRTEVPGAGTVRTYGVITEAEAVFEGASFESDTHRIAELGIMPAAKVRTARVAVTRVDPEVWVSADPGEEVDRATGEERRKALYADEMERPLPIGLGRDGAPVHVDLDFFDGRKGGHMSISGVSGVATKTSFALFFLRMLTGSPALVGEGAANLRVLVFNVKGEDLLWLDMPNRLFDAHPDAAGDWAKLGVEPTPFPSVRFWAPPRRQSGDVVIPDTGGRLSGVEAFGWTPREFIDESLLEFCFTDAADERNQLHFI